MPCTLDLYVLHVGTISPTTSHSWCLSRWLIVHSFLYSDEDSEWQLRLIPNTYYSPSFTVWAFASPMTFAISSRDASLIRFTLLNSFNRAVLVFSPMPFIVSRADATCRLLRLSRWKVIAKRCTSSWICVSRRNKELCCLIPIVCAGNPKSSSDVRCLLSLAKPAIGIFRCS